MPFKSKSQARAAFSGALGSEMKEKAGEFAAATPGGIGSLPQRKDKPGKRVKLVQKNKKGSKVRLKKSVATDSDSDDK